MPRLEWGRLHEKTYEVGLDRGVFFPREGSGVAWPGLVRVDEYSDEIASREGYIDGQRYLNSPQRSNFQAKLYSFSAPKEFYMCEGLKDLGGGLYASRQQRDSFGFSYRTKVGNADVGQNYGYKIHIVYNAIAFPSTRTYQTIAGTANPILREWELFTTPYQGNDFSWLKADDAGVVTQTKSAFTPTAHLVVSVRSVSPEKLVALEDLLYGTETTDPTLPEPSELLELIR